MPIFCQKTSILLKKHLFCPYFVKKMFILSKTLCSHVIFFKIFHKNHLLSCPKQVRKRQFCQNYTILWAIKVHRMLFFSYFSRTNCCTHAHVLSKYVDSQKKKHTIVKPIFCEKNVPFSQKHCALVTFSQIFHE